MSKSTAREYCKRLTNFQAFISSKYATPLTDDLITNIKDHALDVYDILNGYSAYLLQNHVITTLTLKQSIVTVKNFLEYHDVDISPRIVRKNKEPLSKRSIIDILNACSDIKLKT